MYQTLTNVQTGAPVQLQQYIDNRKGDLCVGLKSITFAVGWYNVQAPALFSYRPAGGAGPTTDVPIPPGLYGFNQLADLLSGDAATFSVNQATGLISLSVAAGFEVRLDDALGTVLGLDDGLGGVWLASAIYLGDRPVDLSRTKTLRVHLEELNTTHNVLDGAPSNLLAVLGHGGAAFGSVESVRFEHPEFRRLREGAVTELTVSVRDDQGRPIDNHGLPITAVIELR